MNRARSPERGDPRSRRPVADDYPDQRPTYPRDRGYSPSPPRGPRLEYRNGERDGRDRSRSPGRPTIGRQPSGGWDDRDRDIRARATTNWNSYRPSYENSSPPRRLPIVTNDLDRRTSIQRSANKSSPKSSPARPITIANDSRDRTTSLSAAHSISVSNKKELTVSSPVSDLQASRPSKLSKPNDSNANAKVASPRPDTTAPETTTLSNEKVNRFESTEDRRPANGPPQLSHQPIKLSKNLGATELITQDTTSANGPQDSRQHLAMATPQLTVDAVDALSKFVQEATDLVSLKSQRAAAEKDFTKKDDDFKNGEGNHEKFPPLKEWQKKHKDSARKALRSLQVNCTEKEDILREGATHIILSAQGGIDQERLDLQSKVISLEGTTQDLQKQLLDHQAYIEKQRTEREALDTKARKVVEELTTLRNAHDVFASEIKPLINEAQRNASKSVAELKGMKQSNTRVENGLAEISAKLPENSKASFLALSTRVDDLSAKLPEDLKAAFPALSARVDVLSVSMPENLKVEFSDLSSRVASLATNGARKSISNNDEPVRDATVQTLNSYNQRLVKVENQVKSGLGPLTMHVTSMVKEQRSVREHVTTGQSTIDSLLGRVTDLESQDHTASMVELRDKVNAANDKVDTRLSTLPSDVELAGFRTKLAFAESATAKVDKLLKDTESLKKRMDDMEKQPRRDRHTSASVEASYGREQLVGIEKRLADVEKQSRSARTSPAESANAMKDQLKQTLDALDDLQKQIKILETKLDASEKHTRESSDLVNASTSTAAPAAEAAEAAEIAHDCLKKEMVDIVNHILEESADTMCVEVDKLESTVKQLMKQVDNLSNVFVPLSSLTEVNNKLVDFFDSLKQHEAQVNNNLGDLSGKIGSLTQQDQAHDTALRQIDGKYNQWVGGLSTQVNAIDSTDKDIEMGLAHLSGRYDNLNTKDMAMYMLNQIDSAYPNLRNAENTLVQHRDLLAKLSAEGATATQTLREDLGVLSNQMATAQETAKEAQATIDELKKRMEGTSADRMKIATRIAGFSFEIDDLKDWKAKQEARETAREAAIPPAVDQDTSVSNDMPGDAFLRPVVDQQGTPVSNGTPGNAKRVHNHAKHDSTSSRQSSSSARSGEPSAKRRRENGTQPPLATNSNGVLRSPRPKKRKQFHTTQVRADDDDFDIEPPRRHAPSEDEDD